MNYTLFTRDPMNHAKVFIITQSDDYASAKSYANRIGGSIMDTNQFRENFRPTSPNRMEGILTLGGNPS